MLKEIKEIKVWLNWLLNVIQTNDQYKTYKKIVTSQLQ